MLRICSSLLALFIFWLLLSGMFTPFLVASGLGSAIVIAFLSHRMGVIDEEGHPVHLAWRTAITYWPWLLKEIAKSSWVVTKHILNPTLSISPTLVEFQPDQKTNLALVIHANSITLTPGTISIEVEPNRFLVHSLTREGAVGLAGSDMDRRCSGLEGR